MENYAKLSDYGIRPTKDLIDKIGIYSRKYGVSEYYIKMALVKCNSQKVNPHVVKYALDQQAKGKSGTIKTKESKKKNNQKETTSKRAVGHTSPFYKEYIMSDAWKAKRREAIKHYGQNCNQCKTFLPINKIQVHHVTYKRLGKELLEDLMIVCKSCHEKIHGIHKDTELDMNQ